MNVNMTVWLNSTASNFPKSDSHVHIVRLGVKLLTHVHTWVRPKLSKMLCAGIKALIHKSA